MNTYQWHCNLQPGYPCNMSRSIMTDASISVQPSAQQSPPTSAVYPIPRLLPSCSSLKRMPREEKGEHSSNCRTEIVFSYKICVIRPRVPPSHGIRRIRMHVLAVPLWL